MSSIWYILLLSMFGCLYGIWLLLSHSSYIVMLLLVYRTSTSFFSKVNITMYKEETLTYAVIFCRSSLLGRGHLVSTTFTFCLPLLVLICTQWTRLASLNLYHLSCGAVSCNTKTTWHKIPTLALENIYVGSIQCGLLLDCPFSAFVILYKLIHRRSKYDNFI